MPLVRVEAVRQGFDEMTVPLSALFAREAVACMSEGRDPTVRELFVVAQRIWVDGADRRSAFAWGWLPAASPDRLASLRADRFVRRRQAVKRLQPGQGRRGCIDGCGRPLTRHIGTG